MKKTTTLSISVGLAVVLAPAFAGSASAADGAPTFYADVLPILQKDCQTCHRPAGDDFFGMVAPMSFVTYEESRPWARSIVRRVKSGEMPPWHASAEYDGVFENERTIDAESVAVLERWAAAGAPAGSESDAPQRPTFAGEGGWSIGEPDLLLTFDEAYHVTDDVRDHYQNITVQLTAENLPRDRYIKAMQFKPDTEAVHHIVIFMLQPGERIGMSAEDAESADLPDNMIGGFGPGTDPTIFQSGYGRLLKAGSSIVFNMHYHKEPGPGTEVWDRSEIAFTFWDEPPKHNVAWGGLRATDFVIPANHPDWIVGAARRFQDDIIVMALFPHMHLRGSAAKYTATYPDGTREVLLDVPSFDFNWQTNYIFKEPKLIPAGTLVEVALHYDNSPENAVRGGFDSNRNVPNGGPTTDEMAVGFIDYTLANPDTPRETPSAGGE